MDQLQDVYRRALETAQVQIGEAVGRTMYAQPTLVCSSSAAPRGTWRKAAVVTLALHWPEQWRHGIRDW